MNNYLYWNHYNYPIYVKPFTEMVLWTDSTSDGKTYQIISTGNNTGDIKRVLVKDYFNKNCKIAYEPDKTSWKQNVV